MFRDNTPHGAMPGGGTIQTTVKWFNPAKGFGFLVPSDGAGDVFLHVSVLQAAGLTSVGPGASVTCEVVQGPKGRQVSRILQVEGGADPGAAPRGDFGGGPRRFAPGPATPMGPATELEGTVKWYNIQKGFGFVAAADGGKDVFVHMSVLRRSGLPALMPDQPVRMTVTTTSKGREATDVSLL